MYFTPSVKTYAWSGAGPALLHTPAFGWPAAGQIQVSPVGTTIAGVRLTTLGHAPPGSDFQNVDGGPHQTLAPAACGDCRDPPTPRLTTTAGLREMTSCSSWSMYNSVLTAVSRAAMPLDEVQRLRTTRRSLARGPVPLTGSVALLNLAVGMQAFRPEDPQPHRAVGRHRLHDGRRHGRRVLGIRAARMVVDHDPADRGFQSGASVYDTSSPQICSTPELASVNA